MNWNALRPHLYMQCSIKRYSFGDASKIKTTNLRLKSTSSGSMEILSATISGGKSTSTLKFSVDDGFVVRVYSSLYQETTFILKMEMVPTSHSGVQHHGTVAWNSQYAKIDLIL